MAARNFRSSPETPSALVMLPSTASPSSGNSTESASVNWNPQGIHVAARAEPDHCHRHRPPNRTDHCVSKKQENRGPCGKGDREQRPIVEIGKLRNRPVEKEGDDHVVIVNLVGKKLKNL